MMTRRHLFTSLYFGSLEMDFFRISIVFRSSCVLVTVSILDRIYQLVTTPHNQDNLGISTHRDICWMDIMSVVQIIPAIRSSYKRNGIGYLNRDTVNNHWSHIYVQLTSIYTIWGYINNYLQTRHVETRIPMKTKWHGNYFCNAGPLWRESTGLRWTPFTVGDKCVALVFSFIVRLNKL